MQVKVLGRYTNPARRIDVYPGDVIEVSDALAEFLQNDAPGCFDLPGQPAGPTKADQQQSAAARQEADALLNSAQQVLSEAQQEAERIRAAAHTDEGQKPFDYPPTGATLPLDATPPVVTGPDNGVTVTHVADEDEQAKVEAERQQAQLDEQAALEKEEAERQKALDLPPRDKQVKGAPKQK